MGQEPEEDIVAATQTELAFLLVFIFVTLFGFALSSANFKGGPGVMQQGLPSTDGTGAIIDPKSDRNAANKTPALAGIEAVPGESIAVGQGNLGEFGAKKAPPLRETRCELGEARDGHRFTLLLEGTGAFGGWGPEITFESCSERALREEEEDRLLAQACGTGGDKAKCESELSAQRQLYFRIGQSAITSFGRGCLKDLCRRVFDAFKADPKKHKQVLIQGHTSSEWKPGASCETLRQAKKSGPLTDGYQCNMQLATDRAVSIYNECWRSLSEAKLVSMKEFEAIFKPVGFGAIEPRRDEKGCEKRRESRRVEFVFVE